MKEAVTKVIDTLTQEDFHGCWNGTTCALQHEDVFWSGLEFHVCTINKSAHTKKSLETYWMILVLHYELIKYWEIFKIYNY